MRRSTFAAAMTAAVVSSVVSVGVSRAFDPTGQQGPPAPATAADVAAVKAQIDKLMPLVHSIAQREYAMCWMLTTVSAVSSATPQQRMDQCYHGYFKFAGLFRPNDLYSDPGP